MIDGHQNVMARIICGYGVPNFYAKIIVKDAKCETTFKHLLMYRSMNKLGVCSNFRDHYQYETDLDGNPLESECQKQPH